MTIIYYSSMIIIIFYYYDLLIASKNFSAMYRFSPSLEFMYSYTAGSPSRIIVRK